MKNILFFGDCHCGHSTGLNEASAFRDGDPGQHLLPAWRHLIDEELPQWDIDAVVLMGDLVDGKQYKSRARGLIFPMFSGKGEGNQIGQAKLIVQELLEACGNPAEVIRIEGTPYHEGFEHALGEFDEALGISEVHQVLDLKLPDGSVLNMAHHPQGGGVLYEGTSKDRQALWNAIMAQAGHIRSADYIVRAHVHNFTEFRRFGKTIWSNPCWQLPTGYAIKANFERFQPDIGVSLLCWDEDFERYRVEDIVYRRNAEHIPLLDRSGK